MTIYSSDFSSSSSGSSVLKIQSITSDNLVNDWNYCVLVDTTSGNVVVTLPPSTANSIGKSVVIKKASNDNNLVCIKSNNTDTINSSSTNIYLYNKDDCITILSTENGKCETLPDNRNSTGSETSFLTATLSATQATDIATEDHIKFNTIVASCGNKISMDITSSYLKKTAGASLGRFTVKAGGVYDIDFEPAFIATPTSSWGTFQLFNLTTNSITCQSGWQCAEGTGNNSYPVINYTYSATVDTTFEIRINVSSGSLNSIGTNSTGEFPRIRIREATRQATVINTVDYAYGNINSTPVSSTVVASLSKVYGNINISNNIINLNAGKTYQIIVSCRATNANNVAINPCIYNLTKSVVLASGSLVSPNWTVNYDMPNGSILCTFTPDVNTQIQIKGDNVGGGSPALVGSFIITQIGSTAVTQLPITNIIGGNDQSSSGYFDIGDMRIQWGVGGTSTYNPTIAFPMPFKNVSYSLNVSLSNCSSSNTYYIQIQTKTVNNFSVIKRFQSGNATGESVEWIAIGLKP